MLQGLEAAGSRGRGPGPPSHQGPPLCSQIISQIWPYLSIIMENKFREKLQPKIREKSVHLRTFTFTKLCFGQKVSAVSPGKGVLGLLCGLLRPCPVPQVTWLGRDPTGLHGAPGPPLHFPAPGPQPRPLGFRAQPHHLCGL